MTVDYTLKNEYTLVESEQVLNDGGNGVRIKGFITRAFNFLACEITTRTNDLAFEGRGNQSGGSAAVSSTYTIQKFSELDSLGEVRFMHAKLVEMGGKPPALEEVVQEKPRQLSGIRLPKITV